MDYLPIFADVKDKKIIVAGGGSMAVAKLWTLIKTRARIYVFATKLDPQITEWAASGLLQAFPRPLEQSDLEGAVILYSTYHSREQNEKIIQLASEARVWVNVVDKADLSDFISPAIVDRDPVVVAIGTEGAAPVLARKIKSHLESYLSPNIGLMSRVAKKFRQSVDVLPFGRARRDFWTKYYGRDAKTEEEAQNLLAEGLYMAQGLGPKQGHVSFIGAGPGDPELLTLKARKLLEEADVVIYDRLVSREILDLVRREALMVSVGKKGYGPAWKQEEINELMIEHARNHELVVRLKGGDPCLFGRLDEETEALSKVEISFDIVPGISTAFASAANLGRSLTRRGRNSEVRIVTGHDLKGFADHDWLALARPGAVTAVYMGAKAARFIQGRLFMHKADPMMPISVLENVSRRNQVTLSTTLRNFVHDIEAAELNGPIMIILGLSKMNAASQELPHVAQI